MRSHRNNAVIAAMALGLMLGGCSSTQNQRVDQPVWVSKNINGLQGSPCNCGGVMPVKVLKAQEKARRKAKKDEI